MSESDHNVQLAVSQRQGNRLHIESSDNEMDIWLKVRKSEAIKRRTLTIIVTTFKVKPEYFCQFSLGLTLENHQYLKCQNKLSIQMSGPKF